MGTALAMECCRRGAEVVMISGPAAVVPNDDAIKVMRVTSAREMYEEAVKRFADADAAILAAAVADYAPETTSSTKSSVRKPAPWNCV